MKKIYLILLFANSIVATGQNNKGFEGKSTIVSGSLDFSSTMLASGRYSGLPYIFNYGLGAEFITTRVSSITLNCSKLNILNDYETMSYDPKVIGEIGVRYYRWRKHASYAPEGKFMEFGIGAAYLQDEFAKLKPTEYLNTSMVIPHFHFKIGEQFLCKNNFVFSYDFDIRIPFYYFHEHKSDRYFTETSDHKRSKEAFNQYIFLNITGFNIKFGYLF